MRIFQDENGEEFEMMDDDIFIEDFDEVPEVIERMNADQYWPNVWRINERGNVDLLSINLKTGEYEIYRSWV